MGLPCIDRQAGRHATYVMTAYIGPCNNVASDKAPSIVVFLCKKLLVRSKAPSTLQCSITNCAGVFACLVICESASIALCYCAPQFDWAM